MLALVSSNKIDRMKLIVFAPKTKESKRKTCHARENKPPSGRRYNMKLNV